MLVLSRKVGQAIVLGGVRVIVNRIDGNCVRLGIEAPEEVTVDREEVFLRKSETDREPVAS